VVAPQTESGGGGGGVNPADRWKIAVGVVVGVIAALLLALAAWLCVRAPPPPSVCLREGQGLLWRGSADARLGDLGSACMLR